MYKTFWNLSHAKTTIKGNHSFTWLASLVALGIITDTQSLQAQETKQQKVSNQHEYTFTEELTPSDSDTNEDSPPVLLEVSPKKESDSNPLSADTVPQQITVESFEVVGSSVFSEEELSAILAEYQNRPLSLSELYQARSAITKLYTDKGYVNSGAYIPPQELEGGKVTISILEGKLEAINVTGTKRLDSDYIRARIEKNAGTPVNVESLLEALQMLRIDPLVKNVSAELSAGISPGTSLLEVAIEEADPFKITTRFDNKRSPSVGTNRRGVGFVHSNLLGFGDRITFDYTNTEGSDSIDTSYTLPLNASNGTFRVAYGTSSNEVIEEPFTALDIESESEYYELGIRQPLIGTPEEELALGLSFSFQESNTRLLDTPFRLSNGASADGETKIGALRFFQEYVNRDDTKVLALRSQFSVGLDVFGATQNVDGIPDSTFFSWRGQSQWVRRLDEDFLFLLRGDIQLSSTELVPLEQFRVGGFDSVRGYRQDFALGDNGLFASAEIRIPLFHLRKIDGVVQLTPFIDMGTIWNSDDLEIDNDFLASIGIGLNFSAGNGFNARLDWGIPLVDVDTQGDSLQEDGLYFTLNWSFL
ncbi:Hemolysin activation/secretion protein [Hyella patelloides LEGE 07179]|uniref:Hemolysin activation/secretion protein n=1 Tax=Hyella patelloides LEGE 07179 TaxID=945734 RepID=A0A563VS82_9CYAN|nr:ShlB/FhaC/HecB family hemolysin secretion/activation protein [Hyella patelloides]VEP14247.1 Hemolysin activation/secretion protein [Hyella patelloides LEGE 07179]